LRNLFLRVFGSLSSLKVTSRRKSGAAGELVVGEACGASLSASQSSSMASEKA